MRASIIVFMALAACSRGSPPVLARAESGNLIFDGKSAGKPGQVCLTRIAVFVEDSGFLALPEAGDDREAVKQGDYWRAYPAADGQCLGTLPLHYGSGLNGSTIVKAKPLRVGPAYTVALTEGPNGYRVGRFRLTSDKQVENLPEERGVTPDAR